MPSLARLVAAHVVADRRAAQENQRHRQRARQILRLGRKCRSPRPAGNGLDRAFEGLFGAFEDGGAVVTPPRPDPEQPLQPAPRRDARTLPAAVRATQPSVQRRAHTAIVAATVLARDFIPQTSHGHLRVTPASNRRPRRPACHRGGKQLSCRRNKPFQHRRLPPADGGTARQSVAAKERRRPH